MSKRYLLAILLMFLGVAADAAGAGTPVRPDPDSNRDQEPVVIAQRIGTTDYVIGAWMKWTPLNPNIPSIPSVPQIRAASMYASNLANRVYPQTLTWGCGSSTPTSGDPFLAENAYTTGDAPKRVYLVGTSYCTDSGDTIPYSPAYANRISVWTSDNAGQSWSTFAGLSEVWRPVGSTQPYWFADKPSVAVSWESQTRGDVYVTHMHYQMCWNSTTMKWRVCDSRILVYRWDGSGSFVLTAEINPGSLGAQSPIISVHSGNAGWITVVWMNKPGTGEATIEAASSADYGVTFHRAHYPLAAGSPVSTIARAGVSFEAVNMIMARFNPRSGTVGIVWHAREPGSSYTDVKFATFDPVRLRFSSRRTVTLPGGPNPEDPLNADKPTPGDQWNPALDYDANWNYLVTYYNMPLEATTFRYRVKGASLAPGGGRLALPSEPDMDISPEYDASIFPKPPKYNRSLGEYQDIWNWFGNWYAIYIGATGTSDAYVVKITP